MSDYCIVNGELCHYGVVGMKWGRRKAAYKAKRDVRLERKANAYDKRAASLTKKAEKQHSVYDLERANRSATKSANYAKKAASLRKKAVSADDTHKRLKLEKKAANLELKSSKAKVKADRVSKSAGYGQKAMKLSIKSDKFAVKAAKTRAKLASNKAYINMVNRKVSSLSAEEMRKVEQPLVKTIRESITNKSR